MIPDIRELNFPEYATLSHATCSLSDMAEKIITSQVKIYGGIKPDFSYDWELVFRGEKYIMPLRKPQAAKENTDINSIIDLTFHHWAVYQLKRWPFFSVVNLNAGTVLPDQYVVPLSLNLGDFCDLLRLVLEYYYGESITLDLNPDWKYKKEPARIDINHSFIWDVLIKLYELYGARWEITPNGSYDRYIIRVGYDATEISHVFKYGFDGGLLKLERQVQSDEIRNMLLGRGGDKNIPYRYFKDVDPTNPSFPADPDWIPELRNVYFAELRGKTFRDYIRGWKTNPRRQLTEDDGTPITPYPHDNTVSPISVESYDAIYGNNSFAYKRGHEDARFNPIEYVKDDKSIALYGPMMGALDNNEEIYPSIQGIVINPYGRVDEVIDVEQILNDDIGENDTESSTESIPLGQNTKRVVSSKNTRELITVIFPVFDVPEGKIATIEPGNYTATAYTQSHPNLNSGREDISEYLVIANQPSLRVYSSGTNTERSASGIPAGKWYWTATFEVEVSDQKNELSSSQVYITVGYENAWLLYSDASSEKSPYTFDIWVKNIWNTTKNHGETDAQYAERVWGPILGDHLGNEAKVVFSDGWLSTSEDYEFPIVKIPVYDTSKSLNSTSDDGTYRSHWRLTLAKSDADYDATGLLIPSTKRQGNPGDHIFFTGIDLSHEYVVWAEESVDEYKIDQLKNISDIRPIWVANLDKVRLVTQLGNETSTILSGIRPGCSLIIQDERFIDGSQQETLYVQSVTYTYGEPSGDDATLIPDVEIILSNSYEVVANPISQLQGEVSALSRQIGSVSNIEQIVRTVGDKKYLRKDRSDRTPYDLAVGGLLRGEGGVQFGPAFASGMTGFGGMIDGKGVAELHSLALRAFLEAPELRFNRTKIILGNSWSAPGAGIVQWVVPDTDASGNLLPTGTLKLHLEQGEIGMVAEDDICMGIFHSIDLPTNALTDGDDGRGNFTFAGFRAVYFRITQIEDPGVNSTLRYALRPVSGSYPVQWHPSEAMHFVCYGNFTDKSRQTSCCTTRTYTRYLTGVNTWEFSEANIAAQFGDLSNLSVFGLDMTGYSIFLNNIYMTGTINQFRKYPLRMEIDVQGPASMAWGETLPVVCTVYRGWEELTADVTRWTVSRDTGVPQDDAVWNQSVKARDFAGTLMVSLTDAENDLGNPPKGVTTVFTFTAEIGNVAQPVTAMLELG